MADALKAEGNKAFAAKDYDRAIDLFSKALDLDQSNFVVWSNRSAAKAGKRDWDGALADADQVSTFFALHVAHNHRAKIILSFPRTLHGQRRYVEAIEAYEAGLNIEDSPALRKGLEEVKAAKGACLAFACIYPRLSLTGLAIIQRQTSAAMEQMQWASEKCLMTRACLPNLPPIHVPPSTSPMRALCKKCVYYVHASQGPRVLRSPLLAPTHTAESPTGTEPNRQRFAHD